LLGDERLDLALALDHQAHGDRLDAAGREPLLDLAPEQRAELVADQTVDHTPRLLRLDEIEIDLAWVPQCLLHGAARDLVEDDPARPEGLLLRRLLDCLGEMPGNRLALTVGIGR